MNKTPISILQELAVQRKLGLPDYYAETSDVFGFSFKCTVQIKNILKTCGYGSNKQEAKQNAAQTALEIMGFPKKIHQQQTTSSSSLPIHNRIFKLRSEPCINYVGKLNEYASTHQINYPTYIDNIVVHGFTTQCCFLKWKTEGHGLKKKDSKQDAAKKMLERLKTENVTIITEKLENLNTKITENVERLNQEILKNYERLSAAKDKIPSNDIDITPVVTLKKATTLEELKCEMEKYGYRYSLEVYQTAPYIMKMQVTGTDVVLMGTGATKEIALTDLFETAVLMFGNDFSMQKEFK